MNLQDETETVCSQVSHIRLCPTRDAQSVLAVLESLDALVAKILEGQQSVYLSDCDILEENIPTLCLERIQKQASPWLVSLLNRPPILQGPAEDEEFLDQVSFLIASLCGRAAVGASNTKWTLANTGSYTLHETSYTEAEIGFQTWGGGVLLAKMLDEKRINVVDKNVLELGSGTGLAGLVCARAGARITIMTDYNDVVLTNADRNVEANGLEKLVKVFKLDWSWADVPKCNEEENPLLRETDFELVIAADCIFHCEHARMVPIAAKRYLSPSPNARFHVLLPLRERFKLEVATFFDNMSKQGWIQESIEMIEKDTINFKYCIYKRPTL